DMVKQGRGGEYVSSFSANEIIQLALQIEREGEAFYREAERLAKKPAAKELFANLAVAELSHAETFRRIAAELEVSSHVYEDEEAERYLRALVAGRVFTDPRVAFDRAAQGDHNALISHAIGFEKETILYFYALKDTVRPEDQEMVERLIAEEKEHIKRLAASLQVK
ncbi:MAG TPA: hypothetical protein DDZ53_03500, partial [Firmicutes bacterium]|nr:hypothetical protein [Bacillota bacterium]